MVNVRLLRSTISTLLIALLAGISGCSPEKSDKIMTSSGYTPASAKLPNIILVMADDMGWGDSGYSGNTIAKTPNLDSMAKAGVRLNQFYAAAPVCSPTRGSVLTGRHPYRYGIYFANVGHLPEEEETLAEMLRAAGYRTGFFGKWHLGTLTLDTLDANRGGRPEHASEYSPPWEHGFETVFATESKVPTYDPMIKPKGIDRNTWWDEVAEGHLSESFGTHYWNEKNELVRENLDGDDSRVIVDRAIPFIVRSAQDDIPFFAVIWLHSPHLPVVAGADDRSVITADDPYTSHYFGSIYAMDRQIGRIRSKLRALGIEQETLLWFTSDNGPEHEYDGTPGSSGGLRGEKRSLYEGGIRVPGLIEWPTHVTSGSVIDAPAVTSDILPTIADYLGLPISPTVELDGVSLRPLLSGERTKRGSGIGFESTSQLAFVSDRYKIIHQPERAVESPSLQGTGTPFGQNQGADLAFEIFDLRSDPGENKNLVETHIEKLGELRSELNRWRESVAVSIAHYEQRSGVVAEYPRLGTSEQ